MTYPEIQAFLSVVYTGNISRAASQLYITQPTLTYRLKTLEKDLGAELFVRGKGQRSVQLTEAGQRFVPIAEKYVKLWEQSSQVSNTQHRPSFRVAATHALSNYVMPYAYALFMARDLPLSVELYSMRHRECYEALERGNVDVVFVSRTLNSVRLSATPIASERMVLLCNKKAGYRNSISPAELPQDKEIYMEWSQEYCLWHEIWFGSGQHALMVDNLRLAEMILNTTDMWCIAPISAVNAIIRNSNLHYLDISDAPPNRPIYMLTYDYHNPHLSMLVEDICSILGQESRIDMLPEREV